MDFAVSYRLKSGEEILKESLIDFKNAELANLNHFRRVWTTRNQKNTPGLFFFSTTEQLVYCESYLERRILLQEDFRNVATWVVDQLFQIHFDGQKHIPDFLILSKHEPKIIDVRAQVFLQTKRFVAGRIALKEALNQIGWAYEICSEPHPLFYTNLDWLSGFRRCPPDYDHFALRIIKILKPGPLPFTVLMQQVGNEMFSKPVVFHLLWKKILSVDLYSPFTSKTIIDLSKEEAT